VTAYSKPAGSDDIPTGLFLATARRSKNWKSASEADGALLQFLRRDDRRRLRALREGRQMKIRPLFAWYDLWIGAFWDQNKRKLYILPLPCIGVVISFR
jgi:hypothetical protein